MPKKLVDDQQLADPVGERLAALARQVSGSPSPAPESVVAEPAAPAIERSEVLIPQPSTPSAAPAASEPRVERHCLACPGSECKWAASPRQCQTDLTCLAEA